MTPLEQIQAWIAETKAFYEKATEGPWYAHGRYLSSRADIRRSAEHVDDLGEADNSLKTIQAIPFFSHEDAKATAISRTSLPAAAKAIEKLMTALEEAEDMVKSWGSYASEYFQKKWHLESDIESFQKTREEVASILCPSSDGKGEA